MSGIVAIFRFDGAPVDSGAVAAMTEAIGYRGPDGIAPWDGDGAAVVHLMLRTTAESLEEAQPLANEDASLVLVMDGWLANYDELRADLLARGAVLRTRSDAELVLRAFEAWGEDCPRHIDGEYAFVVWDARRREALCVKDHAGMRPLHYHWDGRRLLVASDLAGVLAAGDFEPRPNPGMVVEHLANIWYSRNETLWEGVTRLLPAHTMRVGESGPRLRRYWLPSPGAAIRYRDERDYQAHYREMLADVVRRASRTHLPLACDVSGGLDSSAIFAQAHRLQAEGRLRAPALKGYTYDFGPDADPQVDELAYARAVARHLGVELREVAPFMPELDWFASRAKADRDMAPYPNAAMAVNIGRALIADGCRVDLNGEGGDEFLAAYPFNYAEHIAERDWRSLGESWREDSAAFGSRRALAMVYRYGVGPLLPAGLRKLRRSATRPLQSNHPGVMVLIDELAALLERRHKAAMRPSPFADLSPLARSVMSLVESGYTTYLHDFMARNSARLGYEPRSPMFDRKFIEFACAVPARQLRRGRRQKHLHVRSMAGILPDVVLDRTTKALGNLPFAVQLDKLGEGVLTPLLQCGINWIDPDGLRELYRRYDCMPMAQRPIFELWAVFGCVTLFG